MVLTWKAVLGTLLVLALALPACAVEWTVGTARPVGTSLHAVTFNDWANRRGLHVRGGLAPGWNLGLSMEPSSVSYEYGPSRESADLVDDGGTETRSQTSWADASLGRRLVETRNWRWDLVATVGYRWTESSSTDDGSQTARDWMESWAAALSLRPEVRLYRGLWLGAQLGVAHVTSRGRYAYDSGGRRRSEQRKGAISRAFGDLDEYSWHLVWTF